jgi:hypothetical protein
MGVVPLSPRSLKRRRTAAARVVLAAVLGVVEVVKPKLFPEPYHTSIRTGHMWMRELLTGHPNRVRRSMGMHKHVFRKLALALTTKTSLTDSKHVKLVEALGIFLHMIVTNNTTEEEHEWFQRSPDTIHRCVFLSPAMIVLTNSAAIFTGSLTPLYPQHFVWRT